MQELAAGIRCGDRTRVGAGVPARDLVGEHQPRISAATGSFRAGAQQPAGGEGFEHLAGRHRPQRPVAAVDGEPHELVGHPHGVVGVLERERGDHLRERIPGGEQRPAAVLLARLGVDELEDVGV